MESNNHPSQRGLSGEASDELLLPERPRIARGLERSAQEAPCFYTARELARFLRVTETTIYRLAKRGELPSFAIGRSIRFRVRDVEEFMRRSKVDGKSSG